MTVLLDSNDTNDILQRAGVQEYYHGSSFACPSLCDRLKQSLETICGFLGTKLRENQVVASIDLWLVKHYCFRHETIGKDCGDEGSELRQIRWCS